ncbi:helix-turn-helix transcriptional regulator [Bilifractor sp. LCP21S3_A7]|uniref:helix-turn-helix transcriptional regulator n=1 Tax=Bilifractor sp. LCP21S3_A7 TaxID=3438738 RepID=UPI003F925973
MAVQRQKLRMLFIYSILREMTDEDHILSASELGNILKGRYNIETDRRSIYGDIDTLREWGADIVIRKGRDHGYFIGEREFEIPELRMLVDAVQVSKSITEKKSGELIEKLIGFVGEPQRKLLEKQIILYNRPKAKNETVFYVTDAIHSAIYENRQITFQYVEWTVRKEYRFRRNGARYRVSPWALIWDDENYYLIAYEKESDMMRHYRVDKMMNLEIEPEPREGKNLAKDFDPAVFEKKTFGMFSGEDVRVTLICDNRFAGVIIDRFGIDSILIPAGADRFTVMVPVTVSPQFFGWLTALGSGIQILRPERIRRAYLEYLGQVAERYDAVLEISGERTRKKEGAES